MRVLTEKQTGAHITPDIYSHFPSSVPTFATGYTQTCDLFKCKLGVEKRLDLQNLNNVSTWSRWESMSPNILKVGFITFSFLFHLPKFRKCFAAGCGVPQTAVCSQCSHPESGQVVWGLSSESDTPCHSGCVALDVSLPKIFWVTSEIWHRIKPCVNGRKKGTRHSKILTMYRLCLQY